jgi:hypothetical protein
MLGTELGCGPIAKALREWELRPGTPPDWRPPEDAASESSDMVDGCLILDSEGRKQGIR